MFTAVQAAQKRAGVIVMRSCQFTAVQAAQKVENASKMLGHRFTAVQAAQKKWLCDRHVIV